MSKTTTHGAGIVKAELMLDTPFNQSCAVRVQCEVLLDSHTLGRVVVENATHLVTLREGKYTQQRPSIEFHLSVIMQPKLKRCTMWSDEDKLRIKSDLGWVLSRSVTNAENQCINVSSLVCGGDRLSVGGTLQDCSTSTSTTTPSEATLYSFLMWKNRGPLVSLNGTLCQVDPDFPLCPAGSECGLTGDPEDTCNLTGITVGLYVSSGLILLAVMVLIATLLWKCRQHSCWKNTAAKQSRDTKPNNYIY